MDDYACGEYTALKVLHFQHLIRAHLAIVREILADHTWADRNYRYFDLTAGPGIRPKDGTPQIPLVFCQEARATGLPHASTFIEQCPEAFAALSVAMRDGGFSPRLVHGDWTALLPDVINDQMFTERSRYYGLLYYDPRPGGKQLQGLKQLGQLSNLPCMQRIDFLFYASATTIKRIRRAADEHGWQQYQGIRLAQILQWFNKRYWLVREPFGQQQWTFLLGTNWTNFKDYRRIHFHRTDKGEGAAILRRLDCTEDERNGDLPTSLFG